MLLPLLNAEHCDYRDGGAKLGNPDAVSCS